MFQFVYTCFLILFCIWMIRQFILDFIKALNKDLDKNKSTRVDPFEGSALEESKTLSDLYQLADSIYDLRKLKPEYDYVEFKTEYSGIPKVYGNLNLPAILSTTKLSTPPQDMMIMSNFPLQAGRVLIKCRKLNGVFDLDNSQVYEASNGTLFVYKYKAPSLFVPFDEGIFYPPRLKEELDLTHREIFTKTSEIIVDQLPLKEDDELVKLTTANRLTEIQTLAFNQGKQSKETSTEVTNS